MAGDKVYSAVNVAVLALIPIGVRRILDIGCGSGAFARRAKALTGAEVVGITHSRQEAEAAAGMADAVVLADLNTFTFADIGAFDCVVMSHVLEHLYDPQTVLTRLATALTPQSAVIVALPNALAWKNRLAFLRGQFRYTEFGVMDRTHYRFFDSATALELVQDAGYRVVRRADEGHLPLSILRKLIGRTAKKLDAVATRFLPGLFADQFIIIASAPCDAGEKAASANRCDAPR